jgi:hypothetical protein
MLDEEDVTWCQNSHECQLKPMLVPSFFADFQEKSLQEKILNHIQSFNAIDLAQTIWGKHRGI